MNEKIRLLRERLRSLNMDGMIVTNPMSIKYLTNIENEGTLLITRRENIFLTYTMFLESVKSTLTINDEIIVADFRNISSPDYENFFVFCENVGFEENYVTYKQYHYLKQRYRVNNLAETENIIEKIKAVIVDRFMKKETEKQYVPYCGIIYPFGDSKKQLFFTEQAIHTVIHYGYTDRQEDAYVALIKREIIKKGYSSYSFAEAEDDKIRMLQSDINL